MPLIVAVSKDGSRLDASCLTHDGRTYDGPVFDVPPDVAGVLLARPQFRAATADDLPDGEERKPAERKPRARRS